MSFLERFSEGGINKNRLKGGSLRVKNRVDAVSFFLANTDTDSMQAVPTITFETATKKYPKINKSRPVIANKIVAFRELLSSKTTKKSAREAATLVEELNSTMQSWISHENNQGVCPETAQFFSTPTRAALLQRIVMAGFQTTHFGCGGIRATQDFLQLSTLSKFLAS